MPLVEDEPKHPTKILLSVGLPSFMIAAAISIAIHQYAHIFVSSNVCGGGIPDTNNIMPVCNDDGKYVSCALSSVAGPLATFILALASFAVYLHVPRNLFAASMAFINATARLPETIAAFIQLLIHNRASLVVDESASLSLIHLKDPTIGMLILCFFSLTVLFLTVIIVHDTKSVPWKWLVALVLFVVLGPLEGALWRFILSPLMT